MNACRLLLKAKTSRWLKKKCSQSTFNFCYSLNFMARFLISDKQLQRFLLLQTSFLGYFSWTPHLPSLQKSNTKGMKKTRKLISFFSLRLCNNFYRLVCLKSQKNEEEDEKSAKRRTGKKCEFKYLLHLSFVFISRVNFFFSPHPAALFVSLDSVWHLLHDLWCV